MLKKMLIGLAILVVLLIALVVGGFFVAMSQLNSPTFANSIKTEIKTKTGIEVQFSEHKISLSELTLKNLTIPNPKSVQGENLLAVEEVHVLYRLASIFKGSLEVPEVTVTKPTVKLRQSKEGGLILPVDLAQLKTKLAEAQGNKARPATDASFPINAPNVKIIGAEAEVYDSDGALLFKAENANVTAAFIQTSNDRNLDGSLTVKQVTIMPSIKATDIKSPLKLEKDILGLPDITGSLYSGTLKAAASLDTKASPMTFQAKANLASVDMSGLMTGVGSDPQTLLGRLQLDFAGNGSLDAPKEVAGGGTLKITEVQVPKLKDLKVLGTILGVSALKEGKFDSVDAIYKIAGQKVQLEPLGVKSQNLNIQLTGPVGFDKILDLKGNVNMDPGVAKILISFTGIKTIEGGQSIPITVGGPVNDPEIRVDGKLLKDIVAVLSTLNPSQLLQAPGQIIDSATQMIPGLFKKSETTPANGTAPPEEKKSGLFDMFKSKPKDASPTPTPTPTPVPAAVEPHM